MSHIPIRIVGCLACGSLFIKYLGDDIFKCEECSWKGQLARMKQGKMKYYYLDLIKRKIISAERAAELMNVTLQEIISLMNDHHIRVIS